MPTVFASTDVEGRRQFDAYHRAISRRIARMDVQPERPSRFDCTIAEQRVGGLQLLDISSDPVMIERSRQCISVDQRSHYIVGLNMTGRCAIRHDGTEVVVGADTFFLLDKALPYETTFFDRSQRILVCVSRDQLDRRLNDPARYLHMTAPTLAGVGRVAAEYLKLLLAEAGSMSSGHQLQTAETCLDLLAMALDAGQIGAAEPSAARGAGTMLLSRIKAFIRCHLSDPELSPALVAERHGISKRYLHALFAGTDTTLGAWIREERLTRAHATLADPRTAHLTVTEIALRQGFNDIPHFSRQFKARFGLSPTALRGRRHLES